MNLSAKTDFEPVQPPLHLSLVKKPLLKNDKKTRQAFLFTLAGFFILVSDWLLKQFAINNLEEVTSPAGPFFDFALYKNPGVAFSAPIPLPIVVVITIVAVLFLARIALRARTVEPLASVGALFMIFGALGNLTDRLVHGFTIDYLVIFSRSVINFSDILILLGLFLLLSYHSTIPTKK